MHTLARDHALPWLGDQARNVRSLPSRAKKRLILFAVGPSNTIGTRVGAIVMLLATAVLAGAGFLAVSSGVDAGGDSSWFMEQLVGFGTSVWSYAIILLLLFAVIRVTQRSRSAQKAAARTGFSEQTCHRLASEAQTADGASTVVVSPADSVDSACDRILSAFETPYSALDINWGDTHVLDDDIVDAAQKSADAADETDLVVDDRANADPSEHARLSRLELASTLNGRDLFWSFAVPAAITTLAGLVLVQFWAALWVYLLIGAAALVVGSAWYVGAHYWRRRRAKSVRSSRQQASYDDIAVLVKKAETDDVTAYYGWVGGTVYADYNELRLAWTLSEVAHAHIEGEPIPPTIQQKFARNLQQYLPNLEGYEEAVEKAEIRDRVIQEVAESPSRRLPKNRLADRVIRRDKDRIGGVGYDPRLVADAYESVVPYALVEEHVDVETPTEGQKSMSVVRLRTEHVTPEAIATDAQFSSLYQPDYAPDFDLPAVDLHAPEASLSD
ncbi:hypothetical protein C471_09340 [Halorubrum saccharovorum DSM 1137]|uniref:Uncharacterized protein n=1 Tax=Halorubrum saccharovorum DSM 1137 TaxID=1227484 RepID=M0DVB0_9EURY|nr:hypothetical protein [Halorubrum saccharovorum]ELZ38763.1 hypothetical protein C471_09340 [Halorubrum saccharovorum DSM 1137]